MAVSPFMEKIPIVLVVRGTICGNNYKDLYCS